MAAADRFRPTRAGIINLWDYRDEEFVFVNGWLVLRGPNGSGKTKALEVLFPFLLDGRIEPRRLNPFASEERTMKSNILFRGQEVSHAYVWMEFQRADSEFVTIGIGLRAHRHVEKVTRWHFVVDGRVGVDLSLIDDDDRPLNRRDLITGVGADRVYDGVDDYRRAVDQRLFGLSPTRYDQLLDLVLTLRRPQLAKDLNPVELSRTLQSGLRPLDNALIIEAARSFDDMESVANTLQGLVAADEATSSFLAVYATYLRTHARAAADSLTGRRVDCAQRQASVDDAAGELEESAARWQKATELLTAAEGEPGRLRAHLDALKSSAAYQSQEQLAGLRQHVADLSADAERARTISARQTTAVQNRQAELGRAREGLADAAADLQRVMRDIGEEAEAAGVEWTHDDARADDAATRMNGRVAARRDDIRSVREQSHRLDRAEQEHDRAADALAEARQLVAAAEEVAASREAATHTARSRARTALADWSAIHSAVIAELAAGQPAAGEPADSEFADRNLANELLAEELHRVVETAGQPGARTLREVAAEHTDAGVHRVRSEATELQARRRGLDERRTEVTAERNRIASEHDDAPPVAHTRPATREGRDGGPLWRLVDFAPGVPAEEAAAVEAALEAAGLLDAWLHPTAPATAAALEALEKDGHLVALPPAQRPTGRTLADVLVPEKKGGVPTAAVNAVLASISIGSSSPSVDTHGRYSLGVLAGAYAKPAAEYIGATARAARRAARVSECDRVIAGLTTEIAGINDELNRLRRTLDALAAALAQLPPLDAVYAAVHELERAALELRVRREGESTAEAGLNQAVAARQAATLALRRTEAERQLPADRVDEFEGAVRRFETAGQRLTPARRAEAMARDGLIAAEDRLEEAEQAGHEARDNAEAAAQRHLEKLEVFTTLEAAVDDPDSRRVVAEVAETETAITRAEANIRELRKTEGDSNAAHARAGQRLADAREAWRTALIETHREASRLRPFAHADILGLLRCPTHLRWPEPSASDGAPAADLPAEITAVHEAILAVTKDLSPTETSLKQSATRLTAALNDLQQQLPAAGQDHRPEFDTDHSLIVVRIADEFGLTPVARFAERIAKDRHDQEQLLSDAERRIFEDTLLTQLARQIHHRTIESRDLVEAMDKQMRARRMSSGLTVGVGWQLSDDLDAEQREACKLLERDPARLGPAQLSTLRGHFAARIKAARAMSSEHTYRELLAQVLDYRMWRVFAFTLHRPGGSAERLTRARHSQLSGGEQSVSLHLPLFAAANALFTSANATAPRMIGLDEAFAGVDENGRGELMSLATQFDLDLFMTGYDLWASHPGVPGAAHYDLAHSAVEHTVATVLLAWNGTVTTADFDGTLARALGSPETRRMPGAAAAHELALSDELALELD